MKLLILTLVALASLVNAYPAGGPNRVGNPPRGDDVDDILEEAIERYLDPEGVLGIDVDIVDHDEDIPDADDILELDFDDDAKDRYKVHLLSVGTPAGVQFLPIEKSETGRKFRIRRPPPTANEEQSWPNFGTGPTAPRPKFDIVGINPGYSARSSAAKPQPPPQPAGPVVGGGRIDDDIDEIREDIAEKIVDIQEDIVEAQNNPSKAAAEAVDDAIDAKEDAVEDAIEAKVNPAEAAKDAVEDAVDAREDAVEAAIEAKVNPVKATVEAREDAIEAHSDAIEDHHDAVEDKIEADAKVQAVAAVLNGKGSGPGPAGSGVKSSGGPPAAGAGDVIAKAVAAEAQHDLREDIAESNADLAEAKLELAADLANPLKTPVQAHREYAAEVAETKVELDQDVAEFAAKTRNILGGKV